MTSPSNSGLSAASAVPAGTSVLASAAAPHEGGFCGNCGTPLALTARFCHRCGTPFGQGAPTDRVVASPNTVASILPWGVAFVALLALVANLAGKSFGRVKGAALDGSADAPPTSASAGVSAASSPPFAGAPGGPAQASGGPGSLGPGNGGRGNGAVPNIANMSPSERAARLYNRIMAYAEADRTDSVNFFAPMALASHEMLTAPTADERYHYGRIADVTNQPAIAKAQADTMLAERQGNLLGLLLAARAARMSKDAAAERTYDRLLLKVVDRELATRNVDYEQHRADIDRAVAEAKAFK